MPETAFLPFIWLTALLLGQAMKESMQKSLCQGGKQSAVSTDTLLSVRPDDGKQGSA